MSPFLVLCSDTVRSRETWDTLVSERPGAFGATAGGRRAPPVVRYLSSLYTVACLDGETAPHLIDLLRSAELPSVDASRGGGGGCVLCIGHNKVCLLRAADWDSNQPPRADILFPLQGWEEAASWLAGVPVALSPASAAVLDAADPHADWASVLAVAAEAAVTHQKQAGRLADTAWVIRAVV